MHLKKWRLTQTLSMAEAAQRMGLESARTYHRYESGENRPDAPLVERILSVTEGAVTVQDLHQQRLDWLRENKPEAFADEVHASVAEAAE